MQTSTLYKLFSLIQNPFIEVEYIQPLQRIGKSFFNIALIIFLTFPIFSQTTTAKLTRLNGSVEMTEAGKSVKPEVNSNLSLSTKIKTGEDGKVELLLDQSEYLILRNYTIIK